MPRRIKNVAKRSTRENPRVDRNIETQLPDFIMREPKRRERQQHEEPMRYNRVELLPRNLAQETYIDALTDESNTIVFAMGPAGTGKTMLATQFAIKELQSGNIDRIIITRPAVSNGEELGALPGDMIAKMAPWTRPLIDVFREYYSIKTIARMLEEEILEICPLGFMRGRTFKNSIVIFDEAQNSLVGQMKMCLTRIGDGTRMFITGDLRQHDRGFEDNGLRDFINRVDRQRVRGISVCRFNPGDVERHPIIEQVLSVYGEDD